jgi:sialate O-acetylesterase
MNRLFDIAKIDHRIQRLKRLQRPHGITLFKGVLLLSAALLVLLSPVAHGDITLPKFFSDHMVLQQQSDFPVWGMAEADQSLVIRFNGTEHKTTADADGKFSVTIQTPVAGGPYRLEVIDQNNEAGVILDDVMVGEVWLCSGQSNMEWSVEKSADAAAEKLSANNYPQIRLFTVTRHVTDEALTDIAKANPWTICSADNVKDFSAVGFFFGRKLSKTLKDTPIGLINASWGGTRCEAWCSNASLESVDELSPLLNYWAEIERLNDRRRPGNLFNGLISDQGRHLVSRRSQRWPG